VRAQEVSEKNFIHTIHVTPEGKSNVLSIKILKSKTQKQSSRKLFLFGRDQGREREREGGRERGREGGRDEMLLLFLDPFTLSH